MSTRIELKLLVNTIQKNKYKNNFEITVEQGCTTESLVFNFTYTHHDIFSLSLDVPL